MEKAKAIEFVHNRKIIGESNPNDNNLIKIQLKNKLEKKQDPSGGAPIAIKEGKADMYKKMQREKNIQELRQSREVERGQEVHLQETFDKMKKNLNKGDDFSLIKDYRRHKNDEEEDDTIEPIFDYSKRNKNSNNN